MEDDHVYYLHNGPPVHGHDKSDINTFRYVAASLIVYHACSGSRLSGVFGMARINFYRYAKRLREGGADTFFKPNDSRGKLGKTPIEFSPSEAVEFQGESIGNSFTKTSMAMEQGTCNEVGRRRGKYILRITVSAT